MKYNISVEAEVKKITDFKYWDNEQYLCEMFTDIMFDINAEIDNSQLCYTIDKNSISEDIKQNWNTYTDDEKFLFFSEIIENWGDMETFESTKDIWGIDFVKWKLLK